MAQELFSERAREAARASQESSCEEGQENEATQEGQEVRETQVTASQRSSPEDDRRIYVR